MFVNIPTGIHYGYIALERIVVCLFLGSNQRQYCLTFSRAEVSSADNSSKFSNLKKKKKIKLSLLVCSQHEKCIQMSTYIIGPVIVEKVAWILRQCCEFQLFYSKTVRAWTVLTIQVFTTHFTTNTLVVACSSQVVASYRKKKINKSTPAARY